MGDERITTVGFGRLNPSSSPVLALIAPLPYAVLSRDDWTSQVHGAVAKSCQVQGDRVCVIAVCVRVQSTARTCTLLGAVQTPARKTRRRIETETKTTLNLVDSSIFKTARGEPYFCFVIDILFTWRNVLISRKYLLGLQHAPIIGLWYTRKGKIVWVLARSMISRGSLYLSSIYHCTAHAPMNKLRHSYTSAAC